MDELAAVTHAEVIKMWTWLLAMRMEGMNGSK